MAKLILKIEVVPHAEQRYPTSGDWTIAPDGAINVLVSDTGNLASALLTGIHEAIEAILCRAHGVIEMDVCSFDIVHALKHALDDLEPGADPEAPYFKEHAVADVVERLVAVAMGVPWCEHSCREDALFVANGGGPVPNSNSVDFSFDAPVAVDEVLQRR